MGKRSRGAVEEDHDRSDILLRRGVGTGKGGEALGRPLDDRRLNGVRELERG